MNNYVITLLEKAGLYAGLTPTKYSDSNSGPAELKPLDDDTRMALGMGPPGFHMTKPETGNDEHKQEEASSNYVLRPEDVCQYLQTF